MAEQDVGWETEGQLSPVTAKIENLKKQGLRGHQLLHQMCEFLASSKSDLKRELMLDEAAERTMMPVRVLRREVEQICATKAKEKSQRDPAIRLTPLEEMILRVVQTQPTVAGKLREAARGVPAISSSVQAVLAWVEDRARAGEAPATPELLRRIRAEVGEEVEASFLLDADAPAPDERFREDLLRRLGEQTLVAKMVALGYEIRARDEERGKGGCLPRLIHRKKQLAQQLAHLRETGRADDLEKKGRGGAKRIEESLTNRRHTRGRALISGCCGWCGKKITPLNTRSRAGRRQLTNVCLKCEERRNWLRECIKLSEYPARYAARKEEIYGPKREQERQEAIVAMMRDLDVAQPPLDAQPNTTEERLSRMEQMLEKLTAVLGGPPEEANA